MSKLTSEHLSIINHAMNKAIQQNTSLHWNIVGIMNSRDPSYKSQCELLIKLQNESEKIKEVMQSLYKIFEEQFK